MVLDTNVLVSAVLAAGKPRRLLQRCIDGQDALLASPATLQEFVEVIRRPKFGLDEQAVHQILAAVLAVAEAVEPQVHFRAVSEDPDDDRFIDLAVAGRADLIVSGDKHLLKLQTFQGIPILAPAARPCPPGRYVTRQDVLA